MTAPKVTHPALYRSYQFFIALRAYLPRWAGGVRDKLAPGDEALIASILKTTAQRQLFARMPPNDRQHALAVVRALQQAGATYARLTGDYNPLHFDEAFAAGTPFGRLVVQGGLTTGLLHALVAMDMPGPGTVFLSQDWKFTAPVFVGDTITAEAEVLGVHDSKPVCEIGIAVRRQDGELVLEGSAWCYTFAGPA